LVAPSIMLLVLTLSFTYIGQMLLSTKSGEPLLNNFSYSIGGLNLFGHLSKISLVGFIAPAATSSVILAWLLRSQDTRALETLGVGVCITALVFLAFLMSPSYVVRIVDMTRTGGGGGLYSFIMLTLEVFVLLYLSYKWGLVCDVRKISAAFYVAGFLIGATSDLLYAKIGSAIMGGFGVFDGDFMFPLGFALSALCFSRMMRRLEKRRLRAS